MPFSKEFNDVYNLGIKETAKEVGIDAERLDSQIFVSNMLDKIYSEIETADLIIADMSTRNPNVFYEVGYADAKKKFVILLTNNSEDIPFDFKQRPHIIYDIKNITDLKEKLREYCSWAKDELKKISVEPLKTDLTVLSTDLKRTEYSDEGTLNLRMNIYNRSEKTSEKINSIYIFTNPNTTVFVNEKKCNSTLNKTTNYKRHIIHPDFDVIPPNDFFPLDIILQFPLYRSWDEGTRQDVYKKNGNLSFLMNTNSNKYNITHYIETKFEYYNMQF